MSEHDHSPPDDLPPGGAGGQRRRSYPEDVPRVADELIEIRAIRQGLRKLDHWVAAANAQRVQLEERLDRSEMRLVERVRQMEMKKAA